MQYDIHSPMSPGQMYFEESLMEAVTVEGLRLAQGLPDMPLASARDDVRSYLERHGTVAGSGSVSAYRLKLYDELNQLDTHEMAARLQKLVSVTAEMYQKVSGADQAFADAIQRLMR